MLINRRFSMDSQLDDTGQFRFKIPKINVPVICRPASGDEMTGTIFLDSVGSRECSSRDVIDFFNDTSSFFALRIEENSRSVLVSKQSLIVAEVIGVMDRFEKETTIGLAQRKNALVHFLGKESMQVVLLLNMPREYSRLLDFLNRCSVFLPALHNDRFALINARLIYKVEEGE